MVITILWWMFVELKSKILDKAVFFTRFMSKHSKLSLEYILPLESHTVGTKLFLIPPFLAAK